MAWNKNKLINLSGLSRKYNGILIETEEDLMKAIQNKEISLLGIISKKKTPSGPTEAPEWFKKFENKIDQKFDNVDQRLDNVDQRLDKVDQRLDKVDQRLDNIVKKNNLKE